MGAFRKVVITVPAFFDENRRRVTQNAGWLAGLEVIDIINRIETDYANTEAAKRASGLREKLGFRGKFRPATRATQTGAERAKALREQQMGEIKALSTEMMSTPSSQTR